MIEAIKLGLTGFFDNILTLPARRPRRVAVPRPRPARHHAADRLLARVDPQPRPPGARPHRRAPLGEARRAHRPGARGDDPRRDRHASPASGSSSRTSRRRASPRSGATCQDQLGATSGDAARAWRRTGSCADHHPGHGEAADASSTRPGSWRSQQLHRVLQRGPVGDRVPARHARDRQPLRVDARRGRRRQHRPRRPDARAGPRQRRSRSRSASSPTRSASATSPRRSSRSSAGSASSSTRRSTG